MSDAISSQTAIDPDRPWITDPEQDPARMSWLDTFLNPTGESPKLHFTRAWSLLFFAGVLAWPGFGLLAFDANGDELWRFEHGGLRSPYPPASSPVFADGRVYLLEANPNPQLMYGEDFAESAEVAGLDYEPLLQKILYLGLRYRLVGQA